jgi:hypothetical protein
MRSVGAWYTGVSQQNMLKITTTVDSSYAQTQAAAPPHGHSHSQAGPGSHSHTLVESHGGPSHSHDHGNLSTKRRRPTDHDMDKLRSTLKQFVRDWSIEGAVEREACYKPMEDALLAYFSDIPFEERWDSSLRSFRSHMLIVR